MSQLKLSSHRLGLVVTNQPELHNCTLAPKNIQMGALDSQGLICFVFYMVLNGELIFNDMFLKAYEEVAYVVVTVIVCLNL